MSELYLTEDDEEKLKREALDKVLTALVAAVIENTLDFQDTKEQLHNKTRKLVEQKMYSQDLQVAEYSKNFVLNVVDLFFQQFEILGTSK